MDVLFSNCPACHSRFVPWSVWRITRWSCIRCPACSCKLNRRFELRENVVFVGIFGALTWSYWYLGVNPAVLVPTGALLLYLVDVCKVRLFQAKSYRSLTGYEAET